MENLKTFLFVWLDGSRETSRGVSVADAFMRAGYGAGALAALDYYEETDKLDMNSRKEVGIK